MPVLHTRPKSTAHYVPGASTTKNTNWRAHARWIGSGFVLGRERFAVTITVQPNQTARLVGDREFQGIIQLGKTTFPYASTEPAERKQTVAVSELPEDVQDALALSSQELISVSQARDDHIT